MTSHMKPILYWISGSTPAWRVMLALTIKGIAFESRRLDHAAGENREPAYLALNPKGQVPTLVLGDVIIRESMAILAWLDRAFLERPIWGQDTANAAAVWQDVMVFEQDLSPLIRHAAVGLIRNKPIPDPVIPQLEDAVVQLNERLTQSDFLGGASPMANDIWLYPALHWIARGVELHPAAPEAIERLTSSRVALQDWLNRMGHLPGITATYPPHWRT